MKLYEFEAKKVFEKMNIPIPKQYGLIHSGKDLDVLKLEFPLMLKSMVLVGGRGKAGGIKKAKNREEAKKVAADLFRLKIKGFPVECVLVEEAVEEIGACYIGITMDPATFNNVVIVSASGGVDIEQVAVKNPEDILRKEISDNSKEISKEITQELVSALNKSLNGKKEITKTLTNIIAQVYATYQRFDARLCEINPLIITSNGVVAADAKLVLDDNALFRQVELLEMLGITEKRHDVAERTKNELRAQSA
jgi:succinyl-CoA synthetase beta subunit